ncbi:MAG: triose-phosphate isomerase [Parachlamydiales bacterium]|jgi:triosephosphate isomerase
MKKKVLIAGNWKMHKTIEETESFICQLAPEITACDVLVYLAVPFTALKSAAKAAEGSKIIVGAQNMHSEPSGAFTGEISALMLKEAGAEFVLIGHSERRTLFKETDAEVHKKLLRALKDDLQPLLCLGETAQERADGETETVLKGQLEKALKGLSFDLLEKLVIAYEPVWAIGTGQVATPEMAEEVHHFLRKELTGLFGKAASGKIYLLYGGSVKPDNVLALMQKPNIDGALIGGASLEVDSFLKIIQSF